MLIHGRLLVTHNNIMLDEVKSLLQKALRRNSPLALQATKELIGYGKDQLPWKSIVTFIFEDHCLNPVEFFSTLYKLYKKGDKYKSIELLQRGYTCRYAACLQVVALADEYSPEEDYFKTDLPLVPSLLGLVQKEAGKIDVDIVIANIVKYWQEQNTKVLARLFMIVNMAVKVEKRKLTQAGVRSLINRDIKRPTLYNLVLSILYKHTADEYLKELTKTCFNFSAIPDVPEGLILFSVLSNMVHKDVVKAASVDCNNIGKVDWKNVKRLDKMPAWAVDKHTFRGKFGKQSKHIFLKKFGKTSSLTESEVEEFHGLRPKSDLRHFFEEGCVCENDLLPSNPIWEDTQNMYLKHKPSQQKASKMTHSLYSRIRKNKNVIFGDGIKECPKADTSDIRSLLKGKRKSEATIGDGMRKVKKLKVEAGTSHEDVTIGDGMGKVKKLKVEAGTSHEDVTIGDGMRKVKQLKVKAGTSHEDVDKDVDDGSNALPHASQCPSGSDKVCTSEGPTGPLLQLPTGSAKVYTRLNTATRKVWKGPYISVERQNLCMFFHTAMIKVFEDKHTLPYDQRGKYLIFPLVQNNKYETPTSTFRPFYDCIAKKDVTREDGEFVERSTLGLIQLHRFTPSTLEVLPVSIWAHFAFRYILNIGDSGLYNAIATTDLRELYGIDMEEHRKQVKGSALLDLIFVKQPSKALREVIQAKLLTHVEDFSRLVCREFDLKRLRELYRRFGVRDETERCKTRLVDLQSALDRMCKQDLGI